MYLVWICCTHCPDEKGTESTLSNDTCPDEKGTPSPYRTFLGSCTHCPDEKGTESYYLELGDIIESMHNRVALTAPMKRGLKVNLVIDWGLGKICCTHCPDEKGIAWTVALTAPMKRGLKVK